MFSGGCPLKNEHVTMHSCVKIVGKEGGNALNKPYVWTLILLFFHFLLGKIKLQISS
jgi:hypothetical protein